MDGCTLWSKETNNVNLNKPIYFYYKIKRQSLEGNILLINNLSQYSTRLQEMHSLHFNFMVANFFIEISFFQFYILRFILDKFYFYENFSFCSCRHLTNISTLHEIDFWAFDCSSYMAARHRNLFDKVERMPFGLLSSWSNMG